MKAPELPAAERRLVCHRRNRDRETRTVREARYSLQARPFGRSEVVPRNAFRPHSEGVFCLNRR